MSKTLFVDKNTSGAYTPNGSVTQPFVNIMDAINQVISNGDNSSSIPYLIEIIGAGQYSETVDLGNAKIVNITLNGNDGAVLVGPSGANCLQSLSNNNSQSKVYCVNLTFNGKVQFTNTVNNGNMGLYQFLFHNCAFINSTCFQCNNINYVTFYSCSFQGDVSVTNTSQIYMQGSAGFNFGFTNGLTLVTDTGTAMPSGLIKSGTYVNMKNSLMPMPISVDAGSELDAYDGSNLGSSGQALSLYGILHIVMGTILSNLTVYSSGNFISECAANSGTLTINSGATYTPLSSLMVNALQVDQQQQILGGSGTPEGAVVAQVGSIYLRSGGGSGTTFYVKETGTGDTGWVSK